MKNLAAVVKGCVALLILAYVLPLPTAAQNHPDAPSEEYKIYEAVLGLMDHIPKDNPRVNIYNTTLNGKCGEVTENATPLANRCSFLWVKPQTVKDVTQLLQSEWPDMEKATWADFGEKNAESVRLHEPIVTPWKHTLTGPDDGASKDSNSPDLIIFLSRVGFNSKKTEAVVYVLTFSYLDQVKTGGDYFLFRIDKTNHWTPAGRVRYFTVGEDESKSS